MNNELEQKIRTAVVIGDEDQVIELIKHNYEFECKSFVYAGPGHQSKHTCENQWPHDIDGEHSDFLYNWKGTSVEEIVDGKRKLIFNAKHNGDGRCGH